MTYGGPADSAVMLCSFRSGRRCISELRDSAAMARCPLPSTPIDVVLPPEREPWRTKAAHAACRAGCVRCRVQCVLPGLAGARKL